MPKPKLAVLGDSLSQGFQSGAIWRTDLSYPCMIAKALGMAPGTDFRFPVIPGRGRPPDDPDGPQVLGLPFNIEEALRFVQRATGEDVSTLEWLVQFPFRLAQQFDATEAYYERGEGDRPQPVSETYHNLAVWGFTVHDAIALTPEACDAIIAQEEGRRADDPFSSPSASQYRTGKMVLNPGNRRELRRSTMVDRLRQLVEAEGEPEILIIWLGANDCLGTVLDLQVRDMADSSSIVPADPVSRYKRWNLTSVNQFKSDYGRLVAEVQAIVGTRSQVFVGTVPKVTIPPVVRGLGSFDGQHFGAYGRFFLTESTFEPALHKHLTRAQAIMIESRIDAFNRSIRELVAEHANWHVVDAAGALDRLAVRRNNFSDDPAEALRQYYEGHPGPKAHPLLRLKPIPSLLMLDTAEQGQRQGGGLMSLDGVHPSTVGYGIVAELFLTAMKKAGIAGADPLKLDWPGIIKQDSLLKGAPAVWDDVRQSAHAHGLLWEAVFRMLTG